jgi:hypothetical protein
VEARIAARPSANARRYGRTNAHSRTMGDMVAS